VKPFAFRMVPLLGLAVAVMLLATSCGDAESTTEIVDARATPATETLVLPTAVTATKLPFRPTATPRPTVRSCSNPYADGVPDGLTSPTTRLQPLGSPPPIAPFSPAQALHDPALDNVLQQILADEASHFAVVIKNLDDNSTVEIDRGRGFYAASLYKIWIMLEAFHQQAAGLFDFRERFVVSGYYEQFRLNGNELASCSTVYALEALSAMMSTSDNVAANMLYERVGYANVNATLRNIGLKYTGLTKDGDLFVTAGGMATVLEAIARGEAVSSAASAEMISLLELETISDRLPALLPPGTRVAHKTGNWANATHDVGVVFSPNATYVIVVLSDYAWSESANQRIARLSRAVYDYYNPD
jgi:beta-lactamase class A